MNGTEGIFPIPLKLYVIPVDPSRLCVKEVRSLPSDPQVFICRGTMEIVVPSELMWFFQARLSLKRQARM